MNFPVGKTAQGVHAKGRRFSFLVAHAERTGTSGKREGPRAGKTRERQGARVPLEKDKLLKATEPSTLRNGAGNIYERDREPRGMKERDRPAASTVLEGCRILILVAS
ncbi:hypothetical protein WN55_01186 [Dufourea novaeangliae]|uniref:Uncharacterized protein n=1 Tax=Dufourea novaeangliae TaxID=178035 RepID=A0A154PED2_DUFNO|nr:hypothetical protein WN55_01186 [Dufourea novaeangliae]